MKPIKNPHYNIDLMEICHRARNRLGDLPTIHVPRAFKFPCEETRAHTYTAAAILSMLVFEVKLLPLLHNIASLGEYPTKAFDLVKNMRVWTQRLGVWLDESVKTVDIMVIVGQYLSVDGKTIQDEYARQENKRRRGVQEEDIAPSDDEDNESDEMFGKEQGKKREKMPDIPPIVFSRLLNNVEARRHWDQTFGNPIIVGQSQEPWHAQRGAPDARRYIETVKPTLPEQDKVKWLHHQSEENKRLMRGLKKSIVRIVDGAVQEGVSYGAVYTDRRLRRWHQAATPSQIREAFNSLVNRSEIIQIYGYAEMRFVVPEHSDIYLIPMRKGPPQKVQDEAEKKRLSKGRPYTTMMEDDYSVQLNLMSSYMRKSLRTPADECEKVVSVVRKFLRDPCVHTGHQGGEVWKTEFYTDPAVGMTVAPWCFIGCRLHARNLEQINTSVVATIAEKPGISMTNLCRRYQRFLYPSHVEHICFSLALDTPMRIVIRRKVIRKPGLFEASSKVRVEKYLYPLRQVI